MLIAANTKYIIVLLAAMRYACPVISQRRMMIGIGTPSSHRHPERMKLPQ
jgi:hypothetical protein